MEKWINIPGFDLYEISTLGNIRNKKSGLVLKQQVYCAPGRHKHYDMRARLYQNKKGGTYKVHRLMAMAWFDDFNPNLEIDHIDGNSLNNKLSNIKQCTHKENMNNPNTLIVISESHLGKKYNKLKI